MAAAAATPTTLRPAAMTVTLEGTRRAEMAQRPEMARSPRMRWRLGATRWCSANWWIEGSSTSVLKAMGEVPRERFVPRNLRRRSYDDGPLPIAEGQTISQPFIVAAMTESAQVAPSDRALEIGTGSGYGAAVLSRVAADVVSVERHGLLAKSAADLLASLGYDNVTVVTDDGSLGYADGAPYDVIIVTAAGPSVPDALLEQLADGGRLVMPVEREPGDQRLVQVTRHGDELVEADLGAVRFVPLIGDQGWPDQGGQR